MLGAPFTKAEGWKRLGLRTEEAFDSNVYLQDITNLAHRSSWVSVAQPSIECGWKSAPFSIDLGYLPRISVYHSEPSENNQAHASNLNFAGVLGRFSYDATNAFTFVNGRNTPPLYTGQGGLPAIAGFAVRDRRDAFWLKQGARATWTEGRCFVRAVYSGYLHDFRTQQRVEPGYYNYVDRKNFNGGLDLGYKAWANTCLVAGYRYGDQQQSHLLDKMACYSNEYQRALVGVEGQPAPWIKLNVIGGPSFHHFCEDTPQAFGRNHTRFYLDASVALMPTAHDVFQLTATRFEQMTSGGCSAYEDILYRAGYAHTFAGGLELKSEFRVYRGEFEVPLLRDDTIYTPSVQLNWKLKSGLLLGVNYSYEWAVSDIPETPAREYHRQLVAFSVARSF